MNTINKIALIGGTGKSGSFLTRALIQHNYAFKILLRDPLRFNEDYSLAEIIQGDARDYNAVHKLTEGCDAVLSMLGQPRGKSSIFSTATGHVLKAMQAHNISRYIVTTGLSVDAPGDHKNPAAAAGTEWMKSHFPETTADKQAEYALLRASAVNWTLVRLPLIDQTASISPVNISLSDCPGDKISAASLAQFVISLIHDDTYQQQAPFIANR